MYDAGKGIGGHGLGLFMSLENINYRTSPNFGSGNGGVGGLANGS